MEGHKDKPKAICPFNLFKVGAEKFFQENHQCTHSLDHISLDIVNFKRFTADKKRYY